MIGLLIGLVVFALVAYLLWWLLQQFPLPQPVRLIVTVLFVLICIVMLLNYFPLNLPHGRFAN
jgi:hypothetical protein